MIILKMEKLDCLLLPDIPRTGSSVEYSPIFQYCENDCYLAIQDNSLVRFYLGNGDPVRFPCYDIDNNYTYSHHQNQSFSKDQVEGNEQYLGEIPLVITHYIARMLEVSIYGREIDSSTLNQGLIALGYAPIKAKWYKNYLTNGITFEGNCTIVSRSGVTLDKEATLETLITQLYQQVVVSEE